MIKRITIQLTISLLLCQHSATSFAFSGSSIFKFFNGIKLTQISVKALQNFPHNEQIKFLIERGVALGRISSMRSLSFQTAFTTIPHGEKILHACLKDRKCNPSSAIKNIEAYKTKFGYFPSPELSKMVATDDLYLKLALTNPQLSVQDLRLRAGKVAEILMDKNFKTSGWTKIEGEVGRNGFDGLYVKIDQNGNIRNSMVVESKYGHSALLGRTVDGARQMSNQWSNKKIDALIKKYPNDLKYKQIKQQFQQSLVKHRLYRLRVTNNKLYQSIEKVNHINEQNVTTSSISGAERLRSANKIENKIINLNKPIGSYQTIIAKQYISAIN